MMKWVEPSAFSVEMAFVTKKTTEAATRVVLLKKMFLEILQNSQENTCARVFFLIKVAGLRSATLFKKRLWHLCFPVNFAKFLGTPFLQNTSGRLLLKKEVTDKITCTKK